ncbi:hypothetical protein TREMEDRAFT_66761 [Tremella mesenterica DSM 1558]|uniref:uncharacterized protein n=1 Tax=Tremella mesenterica (strain ATCC 24925 / CBS 8224 / DSM 1558 / NBRC 9311 / NRRL Y-6157 / RJB 2259-6 / UBC 559-6) TaxID=578456 RepID=UPI0003F49BAC|nr:uncharacterized protein TREMEDRAFT_66761 [Tremella mesenterica DSM 1558]EIW72203.1 hypothetical protein TREMEDRAFT_66761 [Tremella mesenterica DSM 1558]
MTLDRKASLGLEIEERNASQSEHESSKADPSLGEATWGKTPSGVVFRVPQTHSFLHTLLRTLHRSSLTRLTFLSLIAQPIIFYLLRSHPTIRSIFFLVYFAFWRACYDWGFAWVLRKQSEKRWIVRQLKSRGWLDVDSNSGGSSGRVWAKWWKRELEMQMGEGYKWEDVPAEFNAWLIFRQLVDVVLLNDFVSYSCFAWAHLHFPPNHSWVMHGLRWILGWSLIFFNLWVKVDAHRVVKDYAWYWGDAFWLMVMQNDLVFDGVYEIAPHPMYSVGYAGYYGISMVVGSYTVLFVSLVAHAAQFAFLLWFENPHIERTYGGGKKPLASRVPLSWGTGSSSISMMSDDAAGTSDIIMRRQVSGGSETPGITEGESETEPELPELPPIPERNPEVRHLRSDSSVSFSSVSSTPKLGDKTRQTFSSVPGPKRSKPDSMHDLTNRFFRKPAVVLWHLDMFRASDFATVLLLLYALSTLVPGLRPNIALTAHFLHALSWRLFHSFGLGLMLRAQSKTKWLVRHYLKHYHYPGDPDDSTYHEDARASVVRRATQEAFGNWQVVYNISLLMTYVSFAGLAWKTYNLPCDWTVSGTMLRHVLGILLIALHIWAAASSYEVLGDFGWFYSDFFLIEQIPAQLAYTGIYRFLNNPERSMGGAAFFGLWLMSNSKLVLALAVISHLSHWWFLSSVEKPHMKRLYGDRLRKDGGLTKTLKNVAGRTIATRADKHAPELSRYVREVKGNIEKVEEKVTEAVEEFLDHARPMFSDMVNDTRFLLQQSRERMIITRVASDISAYDTSHYSLHLPSRSDSPIPRFHVGQPIPVSWRAPLNHSKKDWIGIYRLGACRSQLVTRVASMGHWMPLYEEEWDGDTPLESPSIKKGDGGTVIFRGDQLPWQPGQYEVRYHHDGKHNVMARVAPIEIYVDHPEDTTSFKSVHTTLLNIVSLALEQDPKLVPRRARAASCGTVPNSIPNLTTATSSQIPLSVHSTENTTQTFSTVSGEEQTKHVEDVCSASESVGMEEQDGDTSPGALDPDDFVIMDEKQAKRIVSLCELAFGVELSVDVVVADANVGALARRVVGAKSLVS